MSTLRAAAIAAIALAPTFSVAAGIFNTSPQAQSMPAASAPRPSMPSPQAQSTTSTAAPGAYQPTTPPAASVIQPINADPKVMAQFERFPNESDEAYIARMKVVYQRSVADMERVNRAHLEKMKALAPK